MAMDIKELKEKLNVIKGSLGWAKVMNFRNRYVYTQDFTDEGLISWGYIGEGDARRWGQIVTKWNQFTADELESIEKFVALKYPKQFEVTRNSYLIDFKNTDTGETLTVDLKDQKFTKTYADPKRKKRDIKYPHSFFKGMEGRLVATKIPSDDNFKKLVDVIIQKESYCSNMGTFLVRLFDNIHLETYINAGVEFDTRITVPYNFFDKDVRAVLNKHKMRYTQTVESFFGNNHDLGKSMLHHIKDEKNFEEVFNQIAGNMRNVNVLVENYKYDVGRLFEYCKERNWTSGRSTWQRNDLVSFICDYARMAELVFPNGFEKYPKDIIDHHDGVTKLYEKEKIKFDDEKYVKMIDPKLEYANKEFCIIYPKSTGDIQSEGRILSHCVGSYVNSILQGHTTILFMRTKEDKNTPLITVEVRDGRIAQARGKYNRSLSYDEKMFLQEYATKKHFVYGVGRW